MHTSGSEHDYWFEVTTISYYIDEILYTVVRITDPYPEVWISPLTPSNLRIQARLYFPEEFCIF